MTLLESLYYLGYSTKKRYALKGQSRLPSKVVSVGNVTLGGTGKTPAVMALAEEAKKRGIQPCILTRGYKGKAKGPCFVSAGKGPLLDEHQAGDEALLMAEKLQGIPVVKGKDRFKAGIFVIENLALQPLFILDDGFQHWRLYRDTDILLLDSSRPFGNRRLFPLGSLREPINAISRADFIVITKAGINRQRSEGDDLIKEIRHYNTDAQLFFAQRNPVKFITIDDEVIPLEWAKGKSFFGFCGIGNPQSFKETLLSMDIPLKGFMTFRDHHRYSQNDIQSIINDASRSGAEWTVTTEKDIMRLKGLSLPKNLVSLGIKFQVDQTFYDEVFKNGS
jgi:tetraacyldisaccharide 4'-kinase